MATVADDLLEEVLARLNKKKTRETKAPVIARDDRSQAVVLDALTKSTLAVFSTMCGWKVEAGEARNVRESESRYDISGIVSISGSLNATVVVSLDKEIAFSAAEMFLGERPEKMNSDVVDMVGELTNMIGGSAKERCGMDGLTLGIPTVVAGAGHYVAYESGLLLCHVPFNSEKGPFSIEFGIK